MPGKNVIKTYVENGWYHIYNRGIEKRDIFMDSQDYKVFLHFLKRYLTQPLEQTNQVKPRFKDDLFDKIQLIAYCLMPNHFHLIVKQAEKETITSFMRALGNSYTRYFNKKYQRVSPLFQGVYKAVLVKEEPYLLHLSRYIHLNPLEIHGPSEVKPRTGFNLIEYSYSSFGEYLGKRKTTWIHPEEILAFFKTAQRTTLTDFLSYQSFVEDYKEDSGAGEILGALTID